MTSRRRRPQYRPVTIGYRASRWQARLPRQTGLTGVHLRSVLRFASGFHPTRPHGKGLGCAMPASVSCSCLRLLVASNRPHKGLSPSIIHPCPTHLPSSRYARLGQAHTGDLQKRRYTNFKAVDPRGVEVLGVGAGAAPCGLMSGSNPTPRRYRPKGSRSGWLAWMPK